MGGLVNPKKGATPLAWFEAEGTIIGDGRSWDDVRFNVYPSRAAFMDIVFDSDRLGGERGRTEPQIEDSYALLLRPFLDGLAESIVR